MADSWVLQHCQHLQMQAQCFQEGLYIQRINCRQLYCNVSIPCGLPRRKLQWGWELLDTPMARGLAPLAPPGYLGLSPHSELWKKGRLLRVSTG